MLNLTRTAVIVVEHSSSSALESLSLIDARHLQTLADVPGNIFDVPCAKLHTMIFYCFVYCTRYRAWSLSIRYIARVTRRSLPLHRSEYHTQLAKVSFGKYSISQVECIFTFFIILYSLVLFWYGSITARLLSRVHSGKGSFVKYEHRSGQADS